MLIGFVIASVCTCFVSRVLNDQRVNVGHLNELQIECLHFYIQTPTRLQFVKNSVSEFQLCVRTVTLVFAGSNETGFIVCSD